MYEGRIIIKFSTWRMKWIWFRGRLGKAVVLFGFWIGGYGAVDINLSEIEKPPA